MKKKKFITAASAICLAAGAIFLTFKAQDPPAPVVPAAQTPAPAIKESPPPAPPAKAAPPSTPQEKKQPPAKTTIVLEQATRPTSDREPLAYDPDKIQWELNRIFEAEAMDTFPVYTVQTHNPVESKINTQFFGPPKNEVWIRIKPENSREMKEIMAQVADLYRANAAQPEDEITVLHWVGGRPWAKKTYGPEDHGN